MLTQRQVASWGRVFKSLQAVLAHGLLFTFTLLLSLKLDHALRHSWWLLCLSSLVGGRGVLTTYVGYCACTIVFSPLWLFHVVVARGRFSLPAPVMPHNRQWAPSHAIVAAPLLVAFELLLCIRLEGAYVVNLKIIFLPLLALETAILIDNIRALMPGDEESMSDEAIWETLPHFWVAISMIFLLAATIFTLLKLCGCTDLCTLHVLKLYPGDVATLECFAFLVCTKWYNPAIHRQSCIREPSSSTTAVRYLDWSRGIVVVGDDDQQQNCRMCNLQTIGGHIMKIPFICFQIMLFMYLEGTPSRARNIPLRVIFAPLLLLQATGVLFAVYRLLEKIYLLVHSGPAFGYWSIASKARDCLGFMHHGSRLLGWWSIDEGSREELARLYCAETKISGYNTFPPEVVKKMPKSGLIDEIWKLQAALSAQNEITMYSQQEYERLQTV
ncbi:RING-type domain-containing protein [Citrus sinensis]|uniref:RING-type domain-containing protein n=1 Tax=Citrus sinensis TaxID=2711 RepID=A0ACB8LFB7_CITSI|nr:RING-type domain-containing protein [Citrus sinensis]